MTPDLLVSSTRIRNESNSHSHSPLSLQQKLVRGLVGLATAPDTAAAPDRLLERRRAVCERMAAAESHKAWEAAARELDSLENNSRWKTDNSSPVGNYDPDLVSERLRDLDDARTRADVGTMMHLARTSLSRDLGGMGNADLYRHCYVGTKKLIERYVESAIRTIEAIVDSTTAPTSADATARDTLQGMLFARQSFGRSALLLSGGGTFGMSHIGVVKALFEASLLPRIISGASAGSIVCAVLCTRTDDEMPQLVRDFPYGDLAVFDDPGPGGDSSILSHVRLLLTQGNWCDVRHLSRVMRGMLGDMTFQEAYNRTRRVLNICVSSATAYELPRLLNYVTAPNVMIWSAVAASCSVPLVFASAPLFVKDPASGVHREWDPTPQRWIDGSVDNDLPMSRLSEMFNVNHFIVSQVNPHVVPFLAANDTVDPARPASRRPPTDTFGWRRALTSLARDEALHRLQFLAEIGILPNLMTKARSILSQKYAGDINILPALELADLPSILRNPTSEFMVRVGLLGERATWPKLSRIRDSCAIELALDRAVHRLRARAIFSASQTNLRRLSACGRRRPAMVDAAAAAAAPKHHRCRHRRSSGDGVQLAHGCRSFLDTAKPVDDETDEDQRMAVSRRRGASAHPSSRIRDRIRVKRAAHGHFTIDQLHGPMTAPICAAEGVEFDFGMGAGAGLSPPGHVLDHSEDSGNESDTESLWIEHGAQPSRSFVSTEQMEPLNRR